MADRSVVAVPPSEGLVVEFKNAAGAWKVIPGPIDYAESGGAAPTRDVVPMSTGVGKRVGRARVPTITFNAFQVPQHSSWEAMRAAKQNETPLEFRFATAEQELFRGGAADTAAITAAGEVTLTAGAGGGLPSVDGHAIGPGAAVVIGAEGYIIEEIDETVAQTAGGFITVDTETVAGAVLGVIAAAAYKIVIPQVGRPPFRARVIDTDQWSIAAENELQAALMLQPFGQLPKRSLAVSPVV